MDSYKGRPFLLRQLMRPVETGRIVHAQIFAGLQGSGRTTAAELISRALNCTGIGKKPCGLCPSCRRFIDKNAPELIYIRPEDSPTIKIDAIREMIENVSVGPDHGYKCVIIKPADRMTTQAQNAFLKTLEEAPEYAVFFLITDNLPGLLPTIRSRCVLTRFQPLPTEDVYRAVLEQMGEADNPLNGIDESKAMFAAKASGGYIGKALEIAADNSYTTLVTALSDVLDGLKKPDGVSRGTVALLPCKDKADRLLAILETAAEELLRGECVSATAQKIKTCGLRPMTVLQAVMNCRKRLLSNVTYQYALDMLLFEIASTEEN